MRCDKPKTRRAFLRTGFGEAIHFEQNTMFDWTSQTRFEVFFHKRSTVDRMGFAGDPWLSF
ncbi:MAG: hypothetical protein JWQ17_4465 [Tardiphaga sp.]|jgi:hypothetical protein|nr:hypothetical protein [Tardiphaga sp.]